MSISSTTGLPSVDWSAQFSDAELLELREDAAKAKSLDRAEIFAWSLLASLTAYSIGVAPTLVRPCAARCTPASGYLTAPVGSGGGLPAYTLGRFTPYISGGRWYNACACRVGGCTCEDLPEVLLPGPVGKIVAVWQDGVELPRSAYRLEGNSLLRLDGEKWPACQDMTAGPEDPGAFSVTYYRGAAPNLMTQAAAGVLAHEFYLSATGAECRLPWNLSSMTREGESYDFGEGGIDTIASGIPEVAAVIRIYNPNGLKTRPRVIVPGGERARVIA